MSQHLSHNHVVSPSSPSIYSLLKQPWSKFKLYCRIQTIGNAHKVKLAGWVGMIKPCAHKCVHSGLQESSAVMPWNRGGLAAQLLDLTFADRNKERNTRESPVFEAADGGSWQERALKEGSRRLVRRYLGIETYTNTLHHITSHYITLHHITSHCITAHHITSHYITLPHIRVFYVTLPYIALHCSTLHCITLYYKRQLVVRRKHLAPQTSEKILKAYP